MKEARPKTTCCIILLILRSREGAIISLDAVQWRMELVKGLNAEDHKEIFMDTFCIMIVLLVTDRMYLPFKSGEFSCTVCKLYLNKSDPPPNPKTQKGINHHKLSRARTEVEGLDSHNCTYILEAGLQGVKSTRLRTPTRAPEPADAPESPAGSGITRFTYF